MKINETGTQQFTLENECFHGVVIEIDWDFPNVRENIKEISMFFSGHPHVDAPFEEHLRNALELMANAVAYEVVVEDNYGKYLIEALNRREGFFRFDGKYGIKYIDNTIFPDSIRNFNLVD